jgi:hypothetical protein
MFTEIALLRLEEHILTNRHCFAIHKNRHVICTCFWLRFNLSRQLPSSLRSDVANEIQWKCPFPISPLSQSSFPHSTPNCSDGWYQGDMFLLQWFFQLIQGPGPQFHNNFSQKVGLLGWVISSSQGLYLNKRKHKHRINAYTHTEHPSFTWDSNPRSQRSSERRQFML